jgi:DNA polymerase
VKLTIDLESRSRLPLEKVGVHKYARDESTHIFFFAFKVDDKPARLWVAPEFREKGVKSVSDREFFKQIVIADVVEAHNAEFEFTMWHNIMTKRCGAPRIDLKKMRCSAAKAAYYALPRKLGDACRVLNLDAQKSESGRALMLKMCKPRKPTKNNPSDWHETDEQIKELAEYCVADVEAEYALSEALRDIPKDEQELWRIDQIINAAGINVDTYALEVFDARIRRFVKEKTSELLKITSGEIDSVKKTTASLRWLKDVHGVKIPNIQKATVSEALEKPLPRAAKRFLELRQELGLSSVSKLKKMSEMQVNGLVRGTMLYHGASTGRWSGKGIQPHNFPRSTFSEKAINHLLSCDYEMARFLYGEAPEVASKCLRGMIIAPEGKTILCADYSAIEGRVLAWLVGEDQILKAYEKNIDTYKLNAVDIYGVKYERVNYEQRQIGKVCELALGYQGWLGAFHSMSKNYGVEISDDEAKKIILAWRDKRQKTVKYWEKIELAAIRAITTKKPVKYGKITFGVRGEFLHLRLPSGRLLSYFNPTVKTTKTKYGVEKMGIRFYGVDSATHKWMRQSTYGGKITENIVQAIARDILAYAIRQAYHEGYRIAFHVHDEISAYGDPSDDLQDFIGVMTRRPKWAEGLPLKAEGWKGKRYRK